MNKGDHIVPIDVMRFADGCQGIGEDLIGAYWILCCFIYARDGKTLRDDKWLSGWLGCSKRKATSLTNRLIDLGKIYVDGNYLRNHKADEVCEQIRFAKVSAQKNGRAGSEKRWRSKKNKDLPNAPPMHARAREKHIPSSDRSKGYNPPVIPPRQNARVGNRVNLTPWKQEIPADAEISDEEKKFAIDKGIPLSEIPTEWERFKNHHRSEGNTKMDWTAAWKNWVTSPFQKGKKHGTAQRTSSLDRAEAYLQRARGEMPEG